MRPRLIVLNGPPAVGKSTLAHRYADDHPLALRLDVDELRESIDGWRDAPHESGLRARALAAAMADAHLRSGHDVVLAQLYGWSDHLVELEHIAAECGATFVEVVLMADVEVTLDRFVDRAGPPLDDVLATPAGLDTVRELHARIENLRDERPGAVVIEPVWGDVDATYDLLLRVIEEPTA